MKSLKDSVVDVLRDVYDPEIPINVYDLGLIYEINVKENNDVHILMSLTSPTCPTAEFIKEMISDAVCGVEGVNDVDVELTFDPLWTPDRISSEAKEELGFEDVAKDEDLGVKEVFLDIEKTEKICFNCAISEKNIPLLDASYKGEKVRICTKCILKF